MTRRAQRPWVGWFAAAAPRRKAPRSARPRLVLAAALATALCAALVVSSLRLEIFRLRYALTEALHEEKALIEQRNSLEIEVARLRDPRRLKRLARERGFGLPERVIHLDASVDAEPAGR